MFKKTVMIFIAMMLIFHAGEFTYAKDKNTKTKKPAKKIVYLTFDDGPNIYTPKILDILKKKKVHATFFMIEGNMKRYPKTVKRGIKEGNYPGLHSVTHSKYKFYHSPKSAVKEMDKARKELKKVTHFDSKLTRVPYGSKPYLKKSFRDALAKKGYKMWDWNVDTLDWKYNQTRPSLIYSRVKSGIKGVKGPVVILFHDSKGTAKELPQIIDYLKKHGYQFEVYSPETKLVMNFWRDRRL